MCRGLWLWPVACIPTLAGFVGKTFTTRSEPVSMSRYLPSQLHPRAPLANTSKGRQTARHISAGTSLGRSPRFFLSFCNFRTAIMIIIDHVCSAIFTKQALLFSTPRPAQLPGGTEILRAAQGIRRKLCLSPDERCQEERSTALLYHLHVAQSLRNSASKWPKSGPENMWDPGTMNGTIGCITGVRLLCTGDPSINITSASRQCLQ